MSNGVQGLGRAGADREFAATALHGYLAVPATEQGPGVLVLGDPGELGDAQRDVCDRLARGGFVALAPRWQGTAEPAVLAAALQELQNVAATEGRRFGVVGLAGGTPLALLSAAGEKRVAAVACLGGAPGPPEADWSSLDAALLAFWPERDAEAAVAQRDALHAALRDAGARMHWEVVPGTARGFLDPGRAFQAEASASVWRRLLVFLQAELAT